jgi:hypothetical protein
VRFGKELFFSEKRKGPFLSFSPLDVRTGWWELQRPSVTREKIKKSSGITGATGTRLLLPFLAIWEKKIHSSCFHYYSLFCYLHPEAFLTNKKILWTTRTAPLEISSSCPGRRRCLRSLTTLLIAQDVSRNAIPELDVWCKQ